MADLEITRLCAKAMGLELWVVGERCEIMNSLVSTGRIYHPLHDDAQAMALVKKFRLHIGCTSDGLWFAEEQGAETAQVHDGGDLLRAICLCVAKKPHSEGGKR